MSGPNLTAIEDVLAKVTDGGKIVPRSIGKGCGPEITAWFVQKVSRAPTVADIRALGNAWGISTHIPVVP